MTSTPENRKTVVKVRGLNTRFGLQIIHDGLNLDLYEGEIMGVVGGSGTGKSVLLKAIIGLHKPEAGQIELWGKPLDQDNEDLSRDRRRWGVLFQDGALFSSLSVAQNIQVPVREHFDLGEDLLVEIACLKLRMVGLPASAGNKYPSELSGGMRKRAGLARALALDPELLFLDEPTAGLDPIGANEFDQLIVELKEALGLTVFLVTHDLDTLHNVCDRVAVLADRRLIAVGTIDELLESEHPWIQEYFLGPRSRAAGIGNAANETGQV